MKIRQLFLEDKEPHVHLESDGFHGDPVDPLLAQKYAENEAHLILGIHVPHSIDNKAVTRSILKHEGLNKRSLKSTA